MGQFLASPSTIDNALLNDDPHITLQDTDPNRPGYEFWNPTGVALFQLNCSNGNGTTLTHCRVTSVMDGTGNLITAHDSLVGATLQTSMAPSPGKIVDLAPDQPQASQLWGVRLQLVIDGSGAGFTMKPGTYLEVPSLTDL